MPSDSIPTTEAPSALATEVHALLDQGGALEQALPHFQRRTEQLEMADAVARTVEQGGRLVVEAGTGVGKTFAYLVPALLSGKRIVISTATKNLQEQLVHRDIPKLQEVLAKKVAVYRRVALLKGRANYLCLHRLDMATADQAGDPSPNALRLHGVREWAKSTRSGDVSEIVALEMDAHLQAQITSTRDNCLGGKCPQFTSCHVYRARRTALAADVVVVNHHLFFADLAGLSGGESELLSHAQVVIFDEAHSLNAVGQQALGRQFSTRRLSAFAQDLQQTGEAEAQGWRDWSSVAMELIGAARQLTACTAQLPVHARTPWEDEAPEGVSASRWAEAWRAMVDALRTVLSELDAVTPVAADFGKLHQRAVAMLETLESLSEPPDDVQVRWLECGLEDVQLMQTPLATGAELQRLWLTSQTTENEKSSQNAAESSAWDEEEDEKSVPEPETGNKKPVRSFIFTSATLGNNDALDWFTGPLGLQDATVLRLKSPFDFAAQAALYIPEHLPITNDPRHSQALAEWIADAVLRLGGRTLVLTTSLRAMATISDVLKQRLASHPEVELLVQGQTAHGDISARFQQADEGSGGDDADKDQPRGCVLVASQSYWQGFDVPGDALQMVVIDKLPFPVPTDPLVQAYSTYLEQQGKNPFKDFALQEAAMALRQGAGRLIRRESDCGILVVADARLTKGYGKWLQRQLPPMRKLASEDEFQAEIARLTRTSTKDCPSA